MKGLEALKEYKSQQQGVNVYADEYLDIIENELKRLYELEKTTLTFSNVQQIMLELEKSKKAIEIIKAKRVDTRALIEILEDEWTWEQYMDEEDDINTGGHQFSRDRLTQNEFDLLREVLKDE